MNREHPVRRRPTPRRRHRRPPRARVARRHQVLRRSPRRWRRHRSRRRRRRRPLRRPRRVRGCPRISIATATASKTREPWAAATPTTRCAMTPISPTGPPPALRVNERSMVGGHHDSRRRAPAGYDRQCRRTSLVRATFYDIRATRHPRRRRRGSPAEMLVAGTDDASSLLRVMGGSKCVDRKQRSGQNRTRLQSRCCTDGRSGGGHREFPLLAPVPAHAHNSRRQPSSTAFSAMP